MELLTNSEVADYVRPDLLEHSPRTATSAIWKAM